MIIETQFEISEMIFAYSPKTQKIINVPLYRIDINIEVSSTTLKYWIRNDNAFEILDKVFKTKDDLITAIS